MKTSCHSCKYVLKEVLPEILECGRGTTRYDAENKNISGILGCTVRLCHGYFKKTLEIISNPIIEAASLPLGGAGTNFANMIVARSRSCPRVSYKRINKKEDTLLHPPYK